MIEMEIIEQQPIEMEILSTGEVQTQTANITPTKQAQTVYPDEGHLFSQVNVSAMPDPLTQEKTVTPSDSVQTVEPDEDYLLSRVTVNPIPSQYYDTTDADVADSDIQRGKIGYGANGKVVGTSDAFVPAGKVTLTQNETDVNIAQYATADVAVQMPEEYAIGGSLATKTLTGYVLSPSLTGLTTWSGNCFQNCNKLQYVRNFPASITTINGYTFQNCAELSDIGSLENLETVGTQAFQGCKKLVLPSVPPKLKSIGTRGMEGLEAMTGTITMPTTLTSIGDNAFNGWRSATGLILPSNITQIPQQAFSYWTSATSVIFLGDVTSIGYRAFMAYLSCMLFDFTHCTSVPTIGTQVFMGDGVHQPPADRKIVVPDNLYDDWIVATNWVTWASNIVRESDYTGA